MAKRPIYATPKMVSVGDDFESKFEVVGFHMEYSTEDQEIPDKVWKH